MTEREKKAAAIISDLLTTELREPHREQHMRAAYLHGDPSGLYIWEREAISWLQGMDEPAPINDWVASLIKKVTITH